MIAGFWKLIFLEGLSFEEFPPLCSFISSDNSLALKVQLTFAFPIESFLFYIWGDLIVSFCSTTSLERPPFFPKNGEASIESTNLLFSEAIEFYSTIFSSPPCLIISTIWGALLFLLTSYIIRGLEEWYVYWLILEVSLMAICSMMMLSFDYFIELLLNSCRWSA